MVYRVYVEKKAGQTHEADSLLREIQDFLGIHSLTGLRVVNRYDAENIDKALFDSAVNTVFSEPQVDNVSYEVPVGDAVFAVEPLPGQYDQRADSAAQCIQIISQGNRPTIRTAKVYVLSGEVSADELAAIKKYVINAVESREASLDVPETLAIAYATPTTVATVEGFISMDEAALSALLDKLGLAMDLDDLKFFRPISGMRKSGIPPLRRFGWWIPIGLTIAAIPPSRPTWTRSSSMIRRFRRLMRNTSLPVWQSTGRKRLPPVPRL